MQDLKKFLDVIEAKNARITCQIDKKNEDGEDTKTIYIYYKTHKFNNNPNATENGIVAVDKLYEDYDKIKKLSEKLTCYVTPLSEKFNYIVIDDVTKEKMGAIKEQGLVPNAIIESSPNNYQCIFKLDKLEDKEINRSVANTLVRKLNKEYGDPHFTGTVHPHRIPNFSNLKPKYLKDGVSPTSKLVRVPSSVVCPKLKEMMDGEVEKLKESLLEVKNRAKDYTYTEEGKINPATAYNKHYDDISKNMSVSNESFAAGMIAVRMCVTGYSQTEIESAIHSAAPTNYQNPHKHDWNDFASRTSKYPFETAKGTAAVNDYMGMKNVWKKVEGRATEKELIKAKYNAKNIYDAPIKAEACKYRGIILEQSNIGVVQKISEDTLVLHKNLDINTEHVNKMALIKYNAGKLQGIQFFDNDVTVSKSR